MKNKRNQQSGKGILRRFLAKTLALTMVLSFLTPAAPMTAYASELEPEDLGEQNCDSTIGTIYYDEHDDQKKEISFDIQGKRDQSTKYTASNAAGFNTTYRNNGYETYISVDGGEQKAVQCRTNGGVAVIDGIEVKMTVLPSPDNEYMFVNYYVYNRENTEKKVKLGSCADIQLDGHKGGPDDPADTAALYKTEKGFHMLNTDNHSSFDLYTGEGITGLKEPDTYWMDKFTYRKSNVFEDGSLSPDEPLQGIDSGLAYSWDITLHPHEMVHRRVAFSCRVNAYYVSGENGEDEEDYLDEYRGTFLYPFQTLEYAIKKIGDRKGYIYIIDYNPIDAPIELSGQNCDITIQSSDFDTEGEVREIEKEGDEGIQSFKRDENYSGPLFRVTGGKWNFRQINISGEKKESAGPLIEATGGAPYAGHRGDGDRRQGNGDESGKRD